MSVKVHIEDYQSIGEIDIEVEGLTLICGPSNIGKSSVQRAISGAIHNDPGDFFVRTGRPNTKVTIDDGDINFTWTKGSGVNKYVVNGVLYEKMGHDAPPPLKEAGYWDLHVGGDVHSVQIAEQFDPPFAIVKGSGTKLGAIYSAITKTNVLNKASSACSKDLRSLKTEMSLRTKDLTKVEEELKDFDTIPFRVREARSLVQSYEAIKEKAARLQRLRVLRDKGKAALNRHKILDWVSRISVPDIDLEASVERLKRLRKLQKQLRLAQQKKEALAPILTIVIPAVALEKLIDKIGVLNIALGTWKDLEDEIKGRKEERYFTVDRINQAEEMLPAVCPLCGYDDNCYDDPEPTEDELTDLKIVDDPDDLDWEGLIE